MEERPYGHVDTRSETRIACALEEPGIRSYSNHRAGVRSWRKHRDLQRGECGSVAAVAAQRTRPAGFGLACAASQEFSGSEDVFSFSCQLFGLAKSKSRV